MRHETKQNGTCTCGHTHPRMTNGTFNTTVAVLKSGKGFPLVEYKDSDGRWEVAGDPLG